MGGSIGKILIIILSFGVGTSKNKNTDHRVKETDDGMSIQVTHETDLIYLLRDSTMSNPLNYCFSCYCDLKDNDHVRRIIISKKKKYLYVKSVLLLLFSFNEN